MDCEGCCTAPSVRTHLWSAILHQSESRSSWARQRAQSSRSGQQASEGSDRYLCVFQPPRFFSCLLASSTSPRRDREVLCVPWAEYKSSQYPYVSIIHTSHPRLPYLQYPTNVHQRLVSCSTCSTLTLSLSLIVSFECRRDELTSSARRCTRHRIPPAPQFEMMALCQFRGMCSELTSSVQCCTPVLTTSPQLSVSSQTVTAN